MSLCGEGSGCALVRPSSSPLAGRLPQEKAEEEMGGGRPALLRRECSSAAVPRRRGALPSAMGPRALLVLLLLSLQTSLGPEFGSCASTLDPNGRNVCRSNSQPPALSCCPGWEQEGPECPLALCTGPNACGQEEVCVRPGVCRCHPGFFGANCTARCPPQLWGPECQERCLCFPRGACDARSGACECGPGWWGPLCGRACPCGPHGRCHRDSGACLCAAGWWGPLCRRPCPCFPGGAPRCHPSSGACLCRPGFWGRACASRCPCHGSPCAQHSGHCHCREGRRGDDCAQPCPEGTYGLLCAHRCGHCSRGSPCSPVDGSCASSCASGWSGTLCAEPCPPGTHGEGCLHTCPPSCRRGEACHPETGACQHCEDGLTGDRCHLPCPANRFGEGCLGVCPFCANGSCHPVSGTCLCQDGFWGESCNRSCPEGFGGPNCSSSCPPVSGHCAWGGHPQAALVAGILTPLLLLLGSFFFLGCWCCRQTQTPRAAPGEGSPLRRVKRHVRWAWPCLPLEGHKLPRVTVSHHEAQPFTPSFIEGPSAANAWPSDSSSWDSQEEEEEEERAQTAVASEGERSGDPLPPLGIPRTSSLAKAPRPAVSFAQGTRFGGPGPPLGKAPQEGPCPKEEEEEAEGLTTIYVTVGRADTTGAGGPEKRDPRGEGGPKYENVPGWAGGSPEGPLYFPACNQ
ncbi:scavenger receptor class F member 1 [Anolis sagrei]|uniref:scavenger receptor class F member 1 n=1 Tax=Anolis sagrei TaxID=38937 RepID=UPI0035205C5A